MTPERLQEIRERENVGGVVDELLDYVDELTATIGKLGLVLKERDEQIAALRRGQGTAPVAREPGPITITPIPDSRRTT